jgi:D-sedoheptulose 7-phosphate isomerase
MEMSAPAGEQTGQSRVTGQSRQIGQNKQIGQPTTTGRPVEAAPEAVETSLEALAHAALRFRRWTPTVTAWGRRLAWVLNGGGRLLVCGNGGSAAEAQHLTAELVGRFGGDRRPLAAIPLHGDTSSTTAIGNDYGADDVFARQVQAHGRPGDVLICLSTSGRSANVIAAARAARRARVTAWALTGPDGGPLADACDDAIQVDAATTSTVQEIHLAAIHLLCRVIDETLGVPA